MSQNDKNERIWKINGLELELDLEDADVFEKAMKAFEQMDEDGKNIDKTGKMPEFIKRYCEIYYNAFDRIFGEGTGEKIFSGKKNMRNCDEVWDSFIGFMQVAVKKANTRRLQLSGKYMPNRDQNREQRRKKKRKKNFNTYNGGKNR